MSLSGRDNLIPEPHHVAESLRTAIHAAIQGVQIEVASAIFHYDQWWQTYYMNGLPIEYKTFQTPPQYRRHDDKLTRTKPQKGFNIACRITFFKAKYRAVYLTFRFHLLSIVENQVQRIDSILIARSIVQLFYRQLFV